MTMDDLQITQPWQTLAVDYPFTTPWFRARQDRVCTHCNEEILYAYHEHPGCALVVALTIDAQIILLKHYRYPVRAWCWEIPAGRLHSDLTGLEVAQLELCEEVGGQTKSWQYLGQFFTSTGSSSEQAKVYLATEVTLSENNPESTELLQVRLVPWYEALEMARSGQITDGPSALALLLSEPYISRCA